MPQVSVIIPAYNAANTIADAVYSALDQIDVVTEILVIDDGSEDQTRDILHQFGTRISVLIQNHQGRSAARNAGLAAATSPYVAFLDADDKWFHTKLSIQLAIIEGHSEMVLTYGQARLMDALGTPLDADKLVGAGAPRHSDFKEELLYGNMIPMLTVLARTEAVKAAGAFDPELSVFEDWDLWLRLAGIGSFQFSDKTLGFYRTYGFARLATLESTEGVVAQCIAMLNRHPSTVQHQEKGCAFVYAKAAIQSTFLGKTALAMKYVKALSSLTHSPQQMLMTEIDDSTLFLSAAEVERTKQQIEDLLISTRLV